MTVKKLEQEIRKEIKSLNDAIDSIRIEASVAKLKAYYNDITEPELIDLNDNHTNHKKELLLEKISTESTQDFCSSHYSMDSSHDDVETTSMSGEYTTEPNNFGFEGGTHSNENNEMECEDKSQGERDMEPLDTIIVIKNKECLHKQCQEEENNVASSTSSPYGDWAEKRRQACEYRRLQKMERELRMQVGIKKHRDRVKNEARKEMKQTKTILVTKEKEVLNEAKSLSSSASSPYGDWAEKRRQACEYKRLQKMERELRMQVGIKNHRDRVKQEVKKEMKHQRPLR